MAFDLHVFVDRDGRTCASLTDENGVRHPPVRLWSSERHAINVLKHTVLVVSEAKKLAK